MCIRDRYVLDGIFGINMIELWGARKQDPTSFTKDSIDANTNLIPPVMPITHHIPEKL